MENCDYRDELKNDDEKRCEAARAEGSESELDGKRFRLGRDFI
jgi:hypothetical protein